ncbi:MAG: FGGY family carbohydrate kinase [Desulfobacterales bacterium]|nr:FGGY family carbohydrate kinase [Desulfobacterales bacterium]
MKRPPYLLGIDIGGTGSKAGVFTLDGEQVGVGYGEYRMISDLPGQAEHDAEAWWQATIQAVRAAIATVAPEEILAVGVGCTNGLIAVDAEGRPLRAAIMLWDQRALPQVERIRQALDGDTVFEIAGNPVAPGAYSLPTILYLQSEEPEIFKAAHKLMVPGGYLVARLTGEFTMDYSRASTTLLFDIRRRQWHKPFLDTLGIPESKLPKPLPSNAVAGEVTPRAAELTGLRAGTPVMAGCMDTIGASIGSGVMEPGECFIIMGTAARVASPLGEAKFDRRFMNCTHVLPDRWLSIGAINGVGSSLRWVRDTFGQMESAVAELTGQDVYDLITAQAAKAPPGSKGLVFLPYISGERTPIWNPYARGVFFGATLGHNRNDFLRSVLEGASFAIRHVIEILEVDGGLNIQQLRIGGAAASSRVWNQIIADILGKTVVSLTRSHTEVLGAAVLAGVSVGAYTDYPQALERIVAVAEEFPPDLEAHAAYERLFPIYKELYLDVAPYFERLAKLDLPQVWITRHH